MRKEIQRYRNELSNRETNFNRMFADKNPINLNAERRGSKNKASVSPAFENGVVMRLARERSSLDTALMREKTLDFARERTLTGSPTKSMNDFNREDIIDHYEARVTHTNFRPSVSCYIKAQCDLINRLRSFDMRYQAAARSQVQKTPTRCQQLWQK